MQSRGCRAAEPGRCRARGAARVAAKWAVASLLALEPTAAPAPPAQAAARRSVAVSVDLNGSFYARDGDIGACISRVGR